MVGSILKGGCKMLRGLAFYVAAGAVLAASPAFAQRKWASGDDSHHHQGLFMRFDAGGAYLKSSSTLNGSDASFSGPAGSFGFSIGGNVIEDLSIFGHLSVSAAPSPTATLGSS